MRVVVQQLFEEGGRPVPRWRITVMPRYEGRLYLATAFHPYFKRSCEVASLKALAAGDDVLPCLTDATVVFIGDGTMTIRGIECDELTQKYYRQSWYVEVFSQ